MKTTDSPTAFRMCVFLMVLVAALNFTSCKQSDKVETTESGSEVEADTMAAPTENDSTKDSGFLMDAANVNMEEIELGKLAQTRSSTTSVKDFAKMMVDGHTKSLNELKGLAQQTGVALPTEIDEKGKSTREELTNADAKSFDKLYMAKMVAGHKETITKFEDARDNAKDADVKGWATKTLPDLQMHLDHATMVQQKIN